MWSTIPYSLNVLFYNEEHSQEHEKILKAVKTIEMKTQELFLAFNCNLRGTSTQQSDLKCDMVL